MHNPVIHQAPEAIDPGVRKSGTVKWFDEKKGYGFILSPEVEGDVFVHHTHIAAKGYRTLIQDEPVEFELFRDARGLRAGKVTRGGV